MQTSQELVSLQFVLWPSPLQTNLGCEGQESPVGQKYEIIQEEDL